MGYSVIVKINPSDSIISSLQLNEGGKISNFIASETQRRMNKYVPFNTGMLRRNITVSKGTITYHSPYAHYMFIGKKAVGASRPAGVKGKNSEDSLNYHTAGTGARWDEAMLKNDEASLARTIEDYIKNGI